LGENQKSFWNYARNRIKTHLALANIEGIDGKLLTSDVNYSNALDIFPILLQN